MLYAKDLKHELRVRGMPDMDLTCNIHDDGFLAVFISDGSITGFTFWDKVSGLVVSIAEYCSAEWRANSGGLFF